MRQKELNNLPKVTILEFEFMPVTATETEQAHLVPRGQVIQTTLVRASHDPENTMPAGKMTMFWKRSHQPKFTQSEPWGTAPGTSLPLTHVLISVPLLGQHLNYLHLQM